MRNDFSDYIIFADESGDHGIASINPEYQEMGLKCHPLESEKPQLTPRLDADRELPIHL